jgi:hypothetical protein
VLRVSLLVLLCRDGMPVALPAAAACRLRLRDLRHAITHIRNCTKFTKKGMQEAHEQVQVHTCINMPTRRTTSRQLCASQFGISSAPCRRCDERGCNWLLRCARQMVHQQLRTARSRTRVRELAHADCVSLRMPRAAVLAHSCVIQ